MTSPKIVLQRRDIPTSLFLGFHAIPRNTYSDHDPKFGVTPQIQIFIQAKHFCILKMGLRWSLRSLPNPNHPGINIDFWDSCGSNCLFFFWHLGWLGWVTQHFWRGSLGCILFSMLLNTFLSFIEMNSVGISQPAAFAIEINKQHRECVAVSARQKIGNICWCFNSTQCFPFQTLIFSSLSFGWPFIANWGCFYRKICLRYLGFLVFFFWGGEIHWVLLWLKISLSTFSVRGTVGWRVWKITPNLAFLEPLAHISASWQPKFPVDKIPAGPSQRPGLAPEPTAPSPRGVLWAPKPVEKQRDRVGLGKMENKRKMAKFPRAGGMWWNEKEGRGKLGSREPCGAWWQKSHCWCHIYAVVCWCGLGIPNAVTFPDHPIPWKGQGSAEQSSTGPWWH